MFPLTCESSVKLLAEPCWEKLGSSCTCAQWSTQKSWREAQGSDGHGFHQSSTKAALKCLRAWTNYCYEFGVSLEWCRLLSTALLKVVQLIITLKNTQSLTCGTQLNSEAFRKGELWAELFPRASLGGREGGRKIPASCVLLLPVLNCWNPGCWEF